MALEYPLYLYLFDANGMHNGKQEINSAEELMKVMDTTVREHIVKGLEVTITDIMDIMVLHAKDGEILFPTRENIKKANQIQT